MANNYFKAVVYGPREIVNGSRTGRRPIEQQTIAFSTQVIKRKSTIAFPGVREIGESPGLVS